MDGSRDAAEHETARCLAAESILVTMPTMRPISTQAQIQATDALMVEQRHVVGPVTSWLSSFVQWAANSTDLRCARVCTLSVRTSLLESYVVLLPERVTSVCVTLGSVGVFELPRPLVALTNLPPQLKPRRQVYSLSMYSRYELYVLITRKSILGSILPLPPHGSPRPNRGRHQHQRGCIGGLPGL